MKLMQTRGAAALVAIGVVAGCGAPSTPEGDGDAGHASSTSASSGTSAPTSPTPASPVPSILARPSPTRLPTVPASGSCRTSPVDIPGSDSDRTGRVVRYTVEIEGGLEELAGDFPAQVRRILVDERGWEVKDGLHFVAVSPEQRAQGEQVDVRIMFSSPSHVDRMCAPLSTNGRLSCHKNGNVMINAWRWANGAQTYGDDLDNYRIYLVGHEVGHALGHAHVGCPGSGRAAPVMLQQTLRLSGCRPSPWPVTAG